MENEINKLKNNSELGNDKYYKKYNMKKTIKIFFFINFINFILMIILIKAIIYLKYIFNKLLPFLNNLEFFVEKNKKNSNMNAFNQNENDYVSKIKYKNDINFYKDLLQLYIENRTKFYIKGREKIMKLGGKYYNDTNVITIQDKLNWLTIHENPENKANIVDKILLHEYSKKILGKDICVPIIKIYNTSDEINFNELPDKFVLKCNHGCGMNILCNNKSRLNQTEAKIKLDKWMKKNYALEGFEFQYLNVKRKISIISYKR